MCYGFKHSPLLIKSEEIVRKKFLIKKFIFRYIAICHPFRSHTMSKLSRAIKHIIVIWIFALILAIPLAIQFDVIVNSHGHKECTVYKEIIQHSFELSTILVFFIPMSIITVLYLLIGLKLRSRNGGGNSRNLNSSVRQQTGTRRVLKMLGMFYFNIL